MGKPFGNELKIIADTYSWAATVDITELERVIKEIRKFPLIVVGSGGSLSASYFLCELNQLWGKISKPVTPLELIGMKNVIHSSSIFFLSASGRNTDILTSCKISLPELPKRMAGLVLTKGSPLQKISEQYSDLKLIEYTNPAGKDGFLATNSLICFFTLLYRAYGNIISTQRLEITKSLSNSMEKFVSEIDKNHTFQVLYSSLSKPVAIDIESKFSEAALGNVIYSDYRNFGHGRHLWLDKRKINTCIVALITPQDKALAVKTLDLIPSEIPIIKLESVYQDHFAAIDLLHQVFYFVEKVGKIQNVDPGKPKVPMFGRNLYHLNYSSLIKESANEIMNVSIQRKIGSTPFRNLTLKDRTYWEKAFTAYRAIIGSNNYGAVVFDYDGTLCANKERYTGPSDDICEILNNLLENNITIGIATGRGKSIKKDLEKFIQPELQGRVIIGYYNGSEIGYLNDSSCPKINPIPHPSLLQIEKELCNLFIGIKLELKEFQITIEFESEEDASYKEDILEYMNLKYNSCLLCVVSSHSLDIIIRPNASKLNVVTRCQELINSKKVKKTLAVLCIGDMGKFPGNDFELLSHPYSLSVDEVSRDSRSCWNFSPPGIHQTDSTIFYFNTIKVSNGFFKIKI